MNIRHVVMGHGLIAAAFTLALLVAPVLHAQTTAHPVRDLPQVRVQAPVTMPPVWKATKGGHAVLLLGTVAPVPVDLKWRSAALDRLLSHADAVVMPTSGTLKLGFFARIKFAATAVGKIWLPKGTTLADILPAAAYQDVVQANRRFDHGDPHMLRARPGAAADMLNMSALHAMHLHKHSPVYAYLRELGHRNDARILEPTYDVKLKDPSAYVSEIDGEHPADISCLSSLAEQLAHRPNHFQTRARAWASGDIAAIHAAHVPELGICDASLFPAKLLAEHGVTHLSAHMRDAWLAAVVSASQSHQLTVTAVPLSVLDGPDGFLTALRTRGFTVTGPSISSTDAR